MSRSTFRSMPLRDAFEFLDRHSLGRRSNRIRTSKDRLGSYSSTVKRAKVIAFLKRRGLLENFVRECWKAGATGKGKQLIQHYLRVYDRVKISSALTGIAGVHYVVSELSRRGCIALPTIRNTAAYDIIAVSRDGKQHANIQVKTTANRSKYWLTPPSELIRSGPNDYTYSCAGSTKSIAGKVSC